MVVNIEFTRPKSTKFPIFSWIVRIVQRTQYSHVRLSWENQVKVPIVYEASGTSLKFLGPAAAKLRNVRIIKHYNISLTNEQYREMVKLCMENAGIEYGIKQLVGIALVRIFNLKKNPFADGKKSQVCSEIVGRFLEEVMGWDTGLDLDIAGPKELDKYLTVKLQEN